VTTPAAPLGPSRFGSHFLGEFRTCPARHYFSHLAPHADSETSRGLQTFTTSSPLLVGAAVHEGLAAWYRSRCAHGADSGLPDLDGAIAAAEAHFTLRRAEFVDDETFVADLALTTRLLREYHEYYGPNGLTPEYPDLRVVCDNAGPVIERELSLDLGDGHEFTARLDALVTYHGRTYTLEHKTTSAQGLSKLFTSMGMSTQALGQHTILHSLGDPLLRPEGVLVNALVKNRSAKSGRPPFERQIVTFDTNMDGWKFRQDAIRTLGQIKAAKAEYTMLVDGADDPYDAARWVYEQRGRSTGACFSFSRCPYLDLCRSPGRELTLTRSFKPRPAEVAPVDPHQPEENDLA